MHFKLYKCKATSSDIVFSIPRLRLTVSHRFASSDANTFLNRKSKAAIENSKIGLARGINLVLKLYTMHHANKFLMHLHASENFTFSPRASYEIPHGFLRLRCSRYSLVRSVRAFSLIEITLGLSSLIFHAPVLAPFLA